MKVAFIGLGTMGYPMAGHLSTAGLDVSVFNRTSSTAEQWCSEYDGRQFTSIAEIASCCDVIITCVGNDDDVRGVYFGESGILENASPDALLIDHTTTSANLARELYVECKKRKLSFVDAPLSGGEAGAVNGCLSSMVGGDKDVVDRASGVINIYSKKIVHLGEAGSGQLCKMTNQICITGILQGLSEAVTFADESGLDIDLVVEALAEGAAGSWQLVNRAKTMSERKFDFGFAIDWMRKDLAFCFDEAERLGLDLPGVERVDNQYAKLQEAGEGRSDTSVLIKQFD